jgi:hypothetical protein
MTISLETEEERAPFFKFMNEVRDEGLINPLAAGQWLQDEFEISRYDARDIIKAWMQSFRRQS